MTTRQDPVAWKSGVTEEEIEAIEKVLSERDRTIVQLDHWRLVSAPTASELALKEQRIRDLDAALAEVTHKISVLRGDVVGQTLSPVGATQQPPPSRLRSQQAAILDELRRQGFNPCCLPLKGPKAAVKKALLANRRLFTAKSFGKAWDQLRREQLIANSP